MRPTSRSIALSLLSLALACAGPRRDDIRSEIPIQEGRSVLAVAPGPWAHEDVPAAVSDTTTLPEWPEDLRTLATLDGPAVLAANAALEKLLASFPKEYAKDCSYTAKAMEVSVALHGGLYFVEINRRVEKCGWAKPGFNPSSHWYELYAVSPEGKVLARFPHHP
jgi:hypothetical protein